MAGKIDAAGQGTPLGFDSQVNSGEAKGTDIDDKVDSAARSALARSALSRSQRPSGGFTRTQDGSFCIGNPSSDVGSHQQETVSSIGHDLSQSARRGGNVDISQSARPSYEGSDEFDGGFHGSITVTSGNPQADKPRSVVMLQSDSTRPTARPSSSSTVMDRVKSTWLDLFPRSRMEDDYELEATGSDVTAEFSSSEDLAEGWVTVEGASTTKSALREPTAIFKTREPRSSIFDRKRTKIKFDGKKQFAPKDELPEEVFDEVFGIGLTMEEFRESQLAGYKPDRDEAKIRAEINEMNDELARAEGGHFTRINMKRLTEISGVPNSVLVNTLSDEQFVGVIKIAIAKLNEELREL
ncbi:MAG: hypothetical protein S4CHLAM37_15000 [Chlamydiia bacterium]|nr:hypothetical protein [Chlamydiia bacterium]